MPLFLTDELQTFVWLQHSKLKEGGALVEPLGEKHAEDHVSKQVDSALLMQLRNRVQLWPAMEYLAVCWQYKLTAGYVSEVCFQR